jgi:endonuclease YncB( thermonuclease family)
MESFKVTAIVDGDTFDVSPGWQWQGSTGNRIRPTGYDTPEQHQRGFEQARDRLTSLLYSKSVELRKAHRIDRGRLVCDVFLNDVYLAKYFPEYAT